MSSKEITIENTHFNAGHRRSSSAARQTPGSRRQSSHGHPADADGSSSQRLQWDEANLYLTEQERTATMKIDEPKTPYAKHYDPAEDPSDEEMDDPMEAAGAQRAGGTVRREDDIPGLSLGEPEEAIPERTPSIEKRAHVDDESVGGHDVDGEEMVGLSAEEREKHKKFEEARKRHYEMKNVAQLLGNPENLPEDEEEDENTQPPPMPPLPKGINGSK